MNRESEEAKPCFPISKANLEAIKDISETLGIPPHEILNRVIENPESMKILKDATSRMKKLRK